MMDKNTEEKKKHSSAYVPYSPYRGVIPDYYPSVPLHWHREFELAIFYEGRGEFRIGDEFINVNPGDIIVIKPGTLHSTEKKGSRKLIYDTIVFDESILFGNHSERCYTDYLNIFDRDDSKITLPINSATSGYAEIKKNTEELFESCFSFSGSGDLNVKIKLMQIFALILESGTVNTGYSFKMSTDVIKPSIDYIRNNYSDKITVETLADQCHLSKSYFMNMFKKVTGKTVIGYLMQVRIDNACKLLANEHMAASEAAVSVGYTNISNFNRQFKQLTGLTPKEFKKRR